jgi:predicted nucleic acid-binding Zn ribbon protein
MAFTSLQKTLAKVLKGYRINDLESIKVFAIWGKIAGEKMAAHCQPVRIDRGILYVEVDDPVWLTQLRYMKVDIQNKIEETLQKDSIKDIRFYLKDSG